MLSFEVPEGYKFDFQEYLFNTERHRLTQTKDGWKSFYWLDEKRKLVKASFHVHIDGKVARSPYRATFGGIDFSPKLSQRHLTEFVNGIEGTLSKIDAQTFEISVAPQHYDDTLFSKQAQSLFDNKFGFLRSNITTVIKIDNDSFESKISNSAKLNLKKSNKLVLLQNDEEKYAEIYDVIKQSRDERNYDLSLSKKQLLIAAEKLSNEVHFFSVQKDSKIIGGAICLKISNRIFYAFYVGHLKSYDSLSPSVCLYNELYKFCQLNNFELLDLGTSVEDGMTKFSLLEFKQSIGAEPSLKLTFSKKLND